MKVMLWSYYCHGKTSLLYNLCKNMKGIPTIPTTGFNVESLNYNGTIMYVWDISQKEIGLQHYLPGSDAIIFLIDSSLLLNDSYCQKNVDELHECIEIFNDYPLLIAITKIDIRRTSTIDIINAYQLQNLYKRKQKFGIIECSSFTSEGIKEIKYWLSSIKN